jgi:hypothetical protein
VSGPQHLLVRQLGFFFRNSPKLFLAKELISYPEWYVAVRGTFATFRRLAHAPPPGVGEAAGAFLADPGA